MQRQNHEKMLTKLNLSEGEIRRLNYERFHYLCPKIQKRLHVIYLKATQYMSNVQISNILFIHFNSVSKYIRIYKEGGFEELCKTHYTVGGSQLEVCKESIIADFNKTSVCSISQAICRIKALTGIERKPTQVRKFMHKHGFKYRKMAPIPAKVNVAYQQQWIEQKLNPAIEQAQKGEVHLLFCDAAHFTLSAFLCMVWSVARVFLKTSHGRNRINVLGTVDAISKEVTTLINTTYITAETILDFLEQLKAKYPLKPIIIVLDNARYQHCKVVLERADKLGITLMFLPAYSPNLNIIERLWKFTKKQVLYARYYDTAEKFHEAIISFFGQINNNFQTELESLLILKFQLFDKVIDSQKQTA